MPQNHTNFTQIEILIAAYKAQDFLNFLRINYVLVQNFQPEPSHLKLYQLDIILNTYSMMEVLFVFQSIEMLMLLIQVQFLNEKWYVSMEKNQVLFTQQQNYKFAIMDSSISIDKQKKALQLKFLLSLGQSGSPIQTIQLLNTIYPFTIYPLTEMPLIEFYEYQEGDLITKDLKQQLISYFYVILLGKCTIRKSIYSYDQQKLIDSNISQKLVFDLKLGETQLIAAKPTSLLKIHNIWMKKAKDKAAVNLRKYKYDKLIKIPFFASLTFSQFNKICDVAVVQTVGPSQILLDELITPYRLYVVAEGQLMIRKSVKFSKQDSVWLQINDELQKKNNFSEQLFQYLVRDPSKGEQFTVDFEIKLVGEGTLLCGPETLNQSPSTYSIQSTLKSKLISIKYPDLYVLDQNRLTDIRNWPILQIDKKQLRKQYYYQLQWQRYKDYLRKDKNIQKLQTKKFDEYLRKDVNLSEKKYSFFPQKVGEGYIIDSPAGKMYRIKQMVYSKV